VQLAKTNAGPASVLIDELDAGVIRQHPATFVVRKSVSAFLRKSETD
jgi:hypothetical protein